MKRYCLAKIIQVEEPDLGKVWTTAIANHAVQGFSQVIPTDEKGVPLFEWALVTVNAPDFADMEKDPDLQFLPDKSKELALSSAEALSVQSVLEPYAIPAGDVKSGDTLRSVVQKVGRFLDTTFEEKNLDVGV